jgi:hypothetical protein
MDQGRTAWRATAEHSAEALAEVLFGESGSKTVAGTPEDNGLRGGSVLEMPISKGIEMVGRDGRRNDLRMTRPQGQRHWPGIAGG